MRCHSAGCGTPTSRILSGTRDTTALHMTVIRVYNETGNVIETHELAGVFREP